MKSSVYVLPLLSVIIIQSEAFSALKSGVSPFSRSDTVRFATSRSDFLKAACLLAAPQTANAFNLVSLASYSSNARNLDRINGGDFSGGSVYDNDPKTPSSRRRRAMQGCKIPSAREEAAVQLGMKNLPEKDCNMRVMEESADFMLTAMQTLDCPTCPYGVKASR